MEYDFLVAEKKFIYRRLKIDILVVSLSFPIIVSHKK